MIWPIFWIVVMLGLVTAFVVAALREKKARTKALQKMSPQPLDAEGLEEPAEDSSIDHFGEAEALPEAEGMETQEDTLK